MVGPSNKENERLISGEAEREKKNNKQNKRDIESMGKGSLLYIDLSPDRAVKIGNAPM